MLVLIMLLTGCGSTADIYFDKYGNAIVTYRYYMEDKEYRAAFVDDNLNVYTFDRTAITKNTPYETITQRKGKKYYVYKFMYKEPIGNGYTYKDIKKKGVVATQELSTNGCLIYTKRRFLNTKTYKNAFADLTITFKQPIIQSNGVISNKGYTVTWTKDDMNNCDFLYAYSESYLKSRVPFSLDMTDNSSTLYTEDDTETLLIYSIIPFKHLYDNGKDILSNGEVKYKDGVYSFKYKYGLGRHKIKAVNKVGSVKYNLMVDYTAPVLRVIINTDETRAKIIFSDTGSGIKTATVNGKRIKSGYTIKHSGTYYVYVYDKAYHSVQANFDLN